MGSKQWNNCFEGVEQLRESDGIISLVKSCALIIDELTMIMNSSSDKYPLPTAEVYCELCLSLQFWKKILTSGTLEWPSRILRSNAALALNQVSHCLLIL